RGKACAGRVRLAPLQAGGERRSTRAAPAREECFPETGGSKRRPTCRSQLPPWASARSNSTEKGPNRSSRGGPHRRPANKDRRRKPGSWSAGHAHQRKQTLAAEHPRGNSHRECARTPCRQDHHVERLPDSPAKLVVHAGDRTQTYHFAVGGQQNRQ